MFEIGSSLREARTRQGLDINEMEFRTKVRAKYLRALEAEQFDQLPGHTYIKGFLRTYADALGMDGQLYVDEYNSRYVAGEDESPLLTRRVPAGGRRQRPRQRRESRLAAIAVVAIVIVTALVIAAWKFGGPAEPKVQGVNLPAAATPAAVAQGVSVTATKGASFMEVRAGSAAGKPLYRGTLERGQTKRFASQKLSLSVASPGNVVVRVGGVRVQVPRSGRAHGHAGLLRRPRAAIVVTGSELVRGERTDLNGPFYAQEALRLGPAARRGSRSSATTPTSWRRRCARASAPTSASSPAASGRRTTTARSSSSRRVAGRSLEVDPGLEEEIGADLAPLRRADGPPVRRLRPGRAQAGDASRGRRSRSASRARPPASCSTPAPASSSCCPARPAS